MSEYLCLLAWLSVLMAQFWKQLLCESIDDSDLEGVDRLFFAGLSGLRSLPEEIFADTVQESFVTKLSHGLQV